MSTVDVIDQDIKAPAKTSPKRLIPIGVVAALVLVYAGSRVWIARQPFEWSGTVEARTVSVGSRTGGRVQQVLATEGDNVKAGQALLVFEPGDVPAQKMMAEGQLAQAQANLDKLEAGSRPEEIEAARARAEQAVAALQESRTGARREQIAQQEARLSAAQVALDKAKLDNDRIKSLFAKGAASKMEADNADAGQRSAIAQRDAQKEVLDELKNGERKEQQEQAAARAKEAQASAKMVEAGARVEDITAAQGVVAAAKGKLESIMVMLDELTVKAPRDARVEALDLRPGDIVAPNATVGVLLEEGQLYVRIYIPETQLGHIKLGQEVPVSVDSFPKRSFKGKVEHISSVGEYSPRNLQTADERADQVFAARVGLLEGTDVLRAGMAAFIEVPK